MKLKLLLLTTILSLTACQPDDSQNAENDQAQKTEQLQDEANRQLGMPDIVNFQERRMAKQILELRDTTISTHTYLVNQMKGCLVYMGNSIGYGLPYAVQYTNPQRIAKFTETPEHGNVTLPQADPNGLYMPAEAHGTWVMMYDANTKKTTPVYIEPDVIVSPFRLTTQECK